MEDEKRRRLDELVARYKLEPSLHDLYVEGLTDKSIIEWFLDKSGLEKEKFTVYEIGTVDIPPEELFKVGLNDANRSRVIVLALQLQQFLKDCLPKVVCIADKDFDELIKNSYISGIEFELLLFTDYTSIEMYLFNPNIIDKLLGLALNLSYLKAENILQNISPILEEIFLLRTANESLNFSMTWLETKSFKRHFDFKKGRSMSFNSNNFIDSYLQKNGKYLHKNVYLEKLEELKQNNISEIKNKIRGHDFIQIFCWYIEDYLSSSKKDFAEPNTLFSALLCCLEMNHLMQEHLFQKLITRFTK